jgi:uncharacterized SAM-binding protein YcdF (DUF218 family)
MTYIQPLLAAVIAMLLVGCIVRGRRASRWLWPTATALLFVITSPPTASVASWTLESLYPPGDTDRQTYTDAIVVLAANMYSPNPPEPVRLPGWATYVRCRHAAWLYHNWRALPLIVSGGSAEGKAAAEIMRDTLVAEGVPPSNIWLEARSLSTYENAVFSAQILRDRGIAAVTLVTEAYHMPRAVQCFRKQGLRVTTSPCAYRSLGFEGQFKNYLPNARAIQNWEDVLHEYAALLWYRLSGKI